MSACDCCRFNGEISFAYDPTCAKNLYAGGGAFEDFYQTTGDLTIGTTVALGAFKVTGGEGSARFLRLSHLDMLSLGGRFSYRFAINGTGTSYVVRPTIGKQRIFMHGWALELDWSDETLRAFSCDDEGVPTGGAWYEQEVSHFFDARNWEASAAIHLPVTIAIGKVNGSGDWRKVIDVAGVPVASKSLPGFPGSFWTGISAEHLGDDMAFSEVSAGIGFHCNTSVRGDPGPTVAQTWWCEQMPLLYHLDTTGLDHSAWTLDKDEHYPDECLLIPTGNMGIAQYRYTRAPIVDGPTTYTPRVFLDAASLSGPTRIGLQGTLSEVRSGGLGTLNSPTYFEEGDTGVHKPAAWDCSGENSLGVEIACSVNCFSTQLSSFDISPVGLVTPATPP